MRKVLLDDLQQIVQSVLRDFTLVIRVAQGAEACSNSPVIVTSVLCGSGTWPNLTWPLKRGYQRSCADVRSILFIGSADSSAIA